jgi:undecaprenyl-diphosphatase
VPHPWDEALFRWVNQGWKSEFADFVFRFFSFGTDLLAVKVCLGVLLVALVWLPASRFTALSSLAAWLVANSFADIVKRTFFAARPCTSILGVHLLTDYTGKPHPLDSSGTASAHAAAMAAIATCVFLSNKRWAAPVAVIALLTGLSRVYAGLHFPSQVALGWLIGILCGVVAVKTWRAFQAFKKKTPAEQSAGVESPSRD